MQVFGFHVKLWVCSQLVMPLMPAFQTAASTGHPRLEVRFLTDE
jgi:hypothetical protein